MNITEKQNLVNEINEECDKIARSINEDTYEDNKTMVCYHSHYGSLAFSIHKESLGEPEEIVKDNVIFLVSKEISILERDIIVDRILKELS